MSDPIFEKKIILVTGGAGFIGSHLCELLLKDARVVCLDNFSTSQEANIDHLLRHPDFEFIRHDINTPFDPEAFPELARFKVKFQGIQEIYHLACPTSPKRFEQHRMQTLYANSLGMKNVLDLAVRYKARVIQASTSVVYGSRPADGHLFKEEEQGSTDTLGPRACYDEGKRFAESCCATYKQVHGLDVRIARIFRTYGPRMPLFEGHMIPDFITNALDGTDLEIFGDASFKTSLSFVTDVADGMMKLMATPEDIGPVNIGSDLDVPIVDVANRIIEMTGSSSKIQYKDSLLFLSQLGLPDIAKAKERLGWIPLVTLDEGLKKTIDYTIANKTLLTGFRSFGE
jgi:UDP-glucuronate decarboxylase